VGSTRNGCSRRNSSTVSGNSCTVRGALTNELINGPWGLAINDQGASAQLFVSNVFDGTVTRLDMTFDQGGITVRDAMRIGSGFGFGPDMAAVVVGPAGLAYDAFRDILYVASEKDDTIFALHGAGKRRRISGPGRWSTRTPRISTGRWV